MSVSSSPDAPADAPTGPTARLPASHARATPPPGPGAGPEWAELQAYQRELERQGEQLQLARAEAEQARAQYIDLYEFAPVGYFSLDPEGVIGQLNQFAGQQLRADRPALLGRRFAAFVVPGQRGAFDEFLARVFGGEGARSIELPLLRADGTRYFGHLEGARVLLPAGAQCRLAVLDVSARHGVGEALAASESRFRKLFTDSADAVVLLQGYAYVDCNAAALRLLGATRREQLVGTTFWDHAPGRQPDGRPTRELFRDAIAQALARGSQRCEALMYRLTGEEIWVEAVLTPIDAADAGPLVHLLWRDVTATRAADQLLRESEARLSLALKASQTGVFTWDFASRQIEVDAAAHRILGRGAAAGQLRQAVIKGQIHTQDLGRLWGGLQAAIAVQQVLDIGFRVVWPDASVHQLSLAGRTVTNGLGHATGFTGVVRDVTHQHAADQELHYKTLVLERLLHKMPLVLSRLRPDGTYLESTGAGLQALGIGAGELVGQNVRALYAKWMPDFQQVLHEGQGEFMTELPTANGPVSFMNYAFFDDQSQQAVVLAVDVTAAEQQRQQLQAEKEFTQRLLDNSVDCIISLDPQGHITVWNAEADRHFGQRAAQVQGRPLLQVLPALRPLLAPADVARVGAGERLDWFSRELPGRPGRYDVHLVPLPAAAGGPTAGGALLILRDVTERDRQAEEATQLRLRQQQEVLAAILSTQETERKRIAEALHNGLGQLLYATKLSLDGHGGPPRAPLASLRLLEDAIKATRTISFELTPGILEDFGLRTALEALVKRIAPARLPVHLHLRNLDERLPAPVEIAVYRTVQELLNNVMKHARATEVEVHVAHEGPRLFVSVEDNGRGFEAASLAAAPLAGIGLAGVRNRVALLGGELLVQSQRGRGTIISFDVPV